MSTIAAMALIGWICITNDVNMVCTATNGGDWPVGSEVTCDKNGNYCQVTFYEDPYDNSDVE